MVSKPLTSDLVFDLLMITDHSSSYISTTAKCSHLLLGSLTFPDHFTS